MIADSLGDEPTAEPIANDNGNPSLNSDMLLLGPVAILRLISMVICDRLRGWLISERIGDQNFLQTDELTLDNALAISFLCTPSDIGNK